MQLQLVAVVQLVYHAVKEEVAVLIHKQDIFYRMEVVEVVQIVELV